MPALSMSTYCSVWASKPKVSDLFSVILPTTIEPSTPAFSTIWRIGASSALSTMLMPAWTSAFSSLSLRTADLARKSATPPPGTMPSSTAAFVACIASSTRSFFSLTSTSVEPPTRMTATPPASFSRRHCQSKIYTTCSRIRADWSSTVFAHELTTRSAGFDAENRLYLFALTMPIGELSVEVELLRAKTERPSPLARRRSADGHDDFRGDRPALWRQARVSSLGRAPLQLLRRPNAEAGKRHASAACAPRAETGHRRRGPARRHQARSGVVFMDRRGTPQGLGSSSRPRRYSRLPQAPAARDASECFALAPQTPPKGRRRA